MKHDDQRAFEFANWAHCEAQQFRKYTNEPYIQHPTEVVQILRTVPHDRDMICAAWLHDTLEDTMQYLQMSDRVKMLETQFHEGIVKMVVELTDSTTLATGNRAARKRIELERIRNISQRAKVVKLADIISNSRSIFKHDENFAGVYALEIRDLLEYALYYADATLWQQADEMVRTFLDDADAYRAKHQDD